MDAKQGRREVEVLFPSRLLEHEPDRCLSRRSCSFRLVDCHWQQPRVHPGAYRLQHLPRHSCSSSSDRHQQQPCLCCRPARSGFNEGTHLQWDPHYREHPRLGVPRGLLKSWVPCLVCASEAKHQRELMGSACAWTQVTHSCAHSWEQGAALQRPLPLLLPAASLACMCIQSWLGDTHSGRHSLDRFNGSPSPGQSVQQAALVVLQLSLSVPGHSVGRVPARRSDQAQNAASTSVDGVE